MIRLTLSYTYILFVSPDQLGDRRFTGKYRSRFTEEVLRGWLGGKIFHVAKYFSWQGEATSSEVILPIGPTQRNESYHFEMAATQVRTCIRGFLEEKLRGSCVGTPMSPDRPV